jgi:hypothetical protein
VLRVGRRHGAEHLRLLVLRVAGAGAGRRVHGDQGQHLQQELSAAVRTYGSLATEFDAPRHDLLESELERHLAAAHDEQDRLSELLGTDPVARPVGWPLRGELISHLDRFRTELEAGKPDSRPWRRRNRAWRLPHARLQRLPSAWRRLIK